MFAVLVLLAIAGGFWWFFSPTVRFQQGFARLIDSPRTHYGFEDWQLVTRVAGRRGARDVALHIHQPTEGRFGEVLLTMSVRASGGADWKDSSLTFRNPPLSRATFDLEGRYELILRLNAGSLEARWTPLPGMRFPGRFDEERWRNTLAQMQVLCEWLEGDPRIG